MRTEQIAQDRLVELGCEKLPRIVREAVELEFSRTIEDSLKRLARRHITVPKVARAFLASVTEKQGGEEDLFTLPEQLETKHIAGTNPPNEF